MPIPRLLGVEPQFPPDLLVQAAQVRIQRMADEIVDALVVQIAGPEAVRVQHRGQALHDLPQRRARGQFRRMNLALAAFERADAQGPQFGDHRSDIEVGVRVRTTGEHGVSPAQSAKPCASNSPSNSAVLR